MFLSILSVAPRPKILLVGMLLLCVFGLFVHVQTSSSIQHPPKVLLISFDGFRSDLLNQSTVPTIFQWAEKSSWFVNGVQSQYLTYTAPNHLSIVTGLFEESHGVTGNRFLLDDGETPFDYFGKEKTAAIERVKTTKILKGDPIWIANERAGPRRKSFVLRWPFAEALFEKEPHKPQHYELWEEYGSLESFKKEVDRMVETLSDGNPSNFVAWYVDQPDTVLHKYGFYTGHLTKVLKELDTLFGYLMESLTTAGLLDNVNIILTADHGHSEIPSYMNVLCVRDHIQEDFGYGDLAIYPKTEDQAELIYRNLTEAIAVLSLKIKVHRKRDLPDQYHYKNSKRIGEILLEPSIGYAVSFGCTKDKQEELFGPKGTDTFHSSVHGQSPENSEMRALLVLSGPDIQNNLKITEVPQNVDLYPLLCRLLQIEPSPNNGSSSQIGAVLKRPPLYYM